MVLYSDGMARNHQSACLGIYRSMGYLNGRPVYKQDEGENYLYYHKDENSWLIGPRIGNNYAWIRNKLEATVEATSTSSSSCSSSSSSSDEDSDTSLGSVGTGSSLSRQKKVKTLKKKNKVGLEIRTPDQLETPWQYRLLITTNQDQEERHLAWRSDDDSLKVEALKGKQLCPCYSTLIDTKSKRIWHIVRDDLE